MTLTGVNWASRPTMQLVTDIYDGPGPASTREAADAWRELSAALSEADVEFAKATQLAMGSWEGSAAESAQAALVPFGQWAEVAEAMAGRISAEVAFNAEAFSTTKAAMPSPGEVAAVAAVTDNPVDKVVGLLTGVPTPGEVAEGVAAAQQAEAAAAMAGYDASTSQFDASYEAFTAAPTLTTDVISASPTTVAAAGYGHFGGGDAESAQHHAATMSAGAGVAGGPTAGGAHSAVSGGTHAAATGARSAGSVPVTASGVGGHSGGTHSTAAAAGIGVGGAGALGLGSARIFSASDAAGRSVGSTNAPPASGGGAGGGGAGGGGVGVGGVAGRRGAKERGRSRTGGFGPTATPVEPSAGVSTAPSGGALSGSSATAAESSVRGPLGARAVVAGGTSGVGASGENLGPRGAAGMAGSVTGGRGGVGTGMGAGAGRANGQDDEEHEIPDYLKDREHFSDGRVVAPAVIGVDDEL